MVAATTGYAQVNLDDVIEIDGVVYAYWYDDIGYWSSWDNCLSAYEDAIGTIYFQCDNDFEVSFDYNVGLDSYFTIIVDNEPQAWVAYSDYLRSDSFTKEFTAGEHTISLEFSLPEGYEGTGTSVNITNFKVIANACDHLFPEESTYPATCTEPSKSECIKCGKLLNDNHSAALGHDFDDNGKCQREGCGFVETRFNVLSSDFVSISIEDNEYPWEYFESEEDGTKGLRSTNQSQNNTSSETTITLSSDEYDFTFSFDLSVSSEEHYDYLYIYVDGAEEYDAYASGIVSDSRIYNFEKGSPHTIRLVYSKDGSGNSRDDRGYISNIKIEKVTQTPDLRPNAISIGEGVEATITLVDNANPWKLVDESDPSKGLTNCSQMQSNYSNLSIRLTNEEPLLLTFDYELKTTYSCGFTATIDTKDEAVINAWAPEKGQISYVLPSSTENPHEIDFNYTSWGASQENVGIVISNIKLTSAKETLDTDNDGEIEVNDLVKNLSGTNPTPETLQKIEAIVWYILNKE